MARALELTGHEKLILNSANRTAELKKDGMLLDLGSIAKGYIGDQAVASLRSLGYPSAAFMAGGDMVFGDAPPGSEGWPVQPAGGRIPLMHLSHCGFSVSGDTVQFVEIGGKRYSHVIDARTGSPLVDRAMCVVIAPSGMLSDPISTMGTILKEKQFMEMVRHRFSGVQAWVFAAE